MINDEKSPTHQSEKAIVEKIKERKKFLHNFNETLKKEENTADISLNIENNHCKIGAFSSKIYKVISKFYVVKKFIKNLRNAAHIRIPSKYQINKMNILNDLSFFKEGLIKEIHGNFIKFKYLAIFFACIMNFFRWLVKPFFYSKTKHYFLVFDPGKSLRSIWDAIHLLVIFFFFFKIPVELSFEINLFQQISEMNYNFACSFRYFGAIFLFLDFLVNFNTGYYKKGSLIFSRKNIAKHYVKSSFLFDFLSYFPIFLEVVNFQFNENLKLLFFFRVSNFFKIFSKIEESIHINFKLFNWLTLIKVFFRIVLLSHLFACGWHYISYQSLNQSSVNW